MDTLFHFAIAILTGLAANAKLDISPLKIVALASTSVLLDVDHFIFQYPRAMHSVFIVLGVPLAIFLLSEKLGKDRRVRLQTYSVLLALMFVSHLSLDLFYEGSVRLFYPLSSIELVAPDLELNFIKSKWKIVTPEGLIMALSTLFIAVGYYVNEFIYFYEGKRESLHQAIEDTFSQG